MQAPTMRNSEFFTIQIKHIPTGNTTSFEGWVTTFSDNFSSVWNEERVYGRMDPLATFTHTSRKIQLAFDVPCEDLVSAQARLEAVNDLITFLYPVYEQQAGTGTQRVGQTLRAAPLIELKWTNLISDASDSSGLIGYLDGVNYAPKVEDGGFGRAAGMQGLMEVENFSGASESEKSEEELLMIKARRNAQAVENLIKNHGAVHGAEYARSTITRATQTKSPVYIPKTLSISLNFTVLHKHLPGWISSVWAVAGNKKEFVFGSREIQGSFPNAQAQVPTTITKTTASKKNADGTMTDVQEKTQIDSALGREILTRDF